MKRIRKWLSVLLIAALVSCVALAAAGCEDWHYINGYYHDHIPCYADFINPDTGEVTYKATSKYYKEIHLQYTGSAKVLEFIFKQCHDDKLVEVKSYEVWITRVNSETGKKEYNQKEMREVGEYHIGICNLDYNTNKFDIYESIQIEIIIEE